MAERQVENGSSYGLFSLFTVISLVILNVIDQQTNSRAVDIFFICCAVLIYLINLAGIASLLVREWIGKLGNFQLFERKRKSLIPWRLIRATDHYVALIISMSGVLLAIWAIEGRKQDTYSYSFPDRLNYHNNWAVWIAFLGDAAALDNGGFGQILLVGEVVLCFSTWHMFLTKLLGWIVFVIVITESYTVTKSPKQRDAKRTKEIRPMHEQDDEEIDLKP